MPGRRAILALGSFAILAVSACPPWVQTSMSDVDFGTWRESQGHHFMLSAEPLRCAPTPSSISCGVDFPMLTTELAFIAGASVVAYFALALLRPNRPT